MLEKISRFLIILVFAISGLLIMEVASPFLSQFVSNEYLKVGFLGVTPLRLVLGLLGLVVFGWLDMNIHVLVLRLTVNRMQPSMKS